MKTDKYTNMIEAFECDLRLAKDGRNSLSDFDADLQKGFGAFGGAFIPAAEWKGRNQSNLR